VPNYENKKGLSDSVSMLVAVNDRTLFVKILSRIAVW